MSNNSIRNFSQQNVSSLNPSQMPKLTTTRHHVDLKTDSDAPAPREQKLWQGIKHIISKYLSALTPISSSVHYGVSKGALESSLFFKNTPSDKAARKGKVEEFASKDEHASIEKFSLEISNEWGVTLDGATLKMKDPITDEYLVVFQPNGTFYEDSLTDARRLGEALNKNVVVFNYRGVGESTGDATRAKDLVNDRKAVLTMLKNQGVDLDKVTLYGHSIGGGVASSVATQSDKVKVIVDRSFSSLSEASKEVVSRATWKVLGSLAKHFFKSYNWELKTARNLNGIAPERVLVISNENDQALKKSALSRKLNETIQQVQVDFKPMQRFDEVWKKNVDHFQDCFNTLTEKPRTIESLTSSSSSESLTGSISEFDDYRSDLKSAIDQLKEEIEKETPDIDTLKTHFKNIEAHVEQNKKALQELDTSFTGSKFPAFEGAFNALKAQFTALEEEAQKSKKPINATIEFDQHITHLASNLETLTIFKAAVESRFGTTKNQTPHLEVDEYLPGPSSGPSQPIGLGF